MGHLVVPVSAISANIVSRHFRSYCRNSKRPATQPWRAGGCPCGVPHEQRNIFVITHALVSGKNP